MYHFHNCISLITKTDVFFFFQNNPKTLDKNKAELNFWVVLERKIHHTVEFGKTDLDISGISERKNHIL